MLVINNNNSNNSNANNNNNNSNNNDNNNGCAQMSALLGKAYRKLSKGIASLSYGRELRCDIEYPARIESWRE